MKCVTIVRCSLIALAAAAMAALLIGCGQQTANSGSAASSSSQPASASVSSSSASTTAVLDASDAVEIALEYNAGTGYEWKYSMDPEGVVELESENTENLATDKTMTGGPLREVFVLRAKKQGETVVTFNLVREWEGEPAETQVYAFTVSDRGELVLNPYKSSFTVEPSFVSHS